MEESYQIVVCKEPNGSPMPIFVMSDKDLTQEYKDAVIANREFFTWNNGCFKMDYVLGVFKG